MPKKATPPVPPPDEVRPPFSDFALDPSILAGLEALNFVHPTAVQAQVIPPLLEGRDLIGRARTGSGKTAAFGLPMIERFREGGQNVRGLVLTPTRELAIQVAAAIGSFAKKLPIRIVAVYGGAPYPPQLKALRNGATIVVGTPGRVIDHLDRKTLDLGHVEMMVLDEADEMLRMGFLEAVERVMESLPDRRQIALLSATMPKPIERVTQQFLHDPVSISVEAQALSVDHIEQSWIRVRQHLKLDVLARILKGAPESTALVFTRTRKGCAEVAERLRKFGITANAIHGDLNQVERERVINRLRSRKVSVLVATDVAARGLDVSHLTHVINFDFPQNAEAYVHRIGRTGRAGAEGTAITLVTPAQLPRLRWLTKAVRFDILETRPPTRADIAALERTELWNELTQEAESSDLDDLRAWLGVTGAVAGIDPDTIAATAVTLLAKHRGLRLFPPDEPAESKKTKAERPKKKSNDERVRLNEVEIFLGVGWKAGIGPADIVGALTNEVDIPGSEIGKISIFDRKTFVGLPRAVGERMLTDFPTLTIRGKPIHISIARTRDNDPREERRFKPRSQRRNSPHPPKRGKGKGKGKGRGKKRSGG